MPPPAAAPPPPPSSCADRSAPGPPPAAPTTPATAPGSPPLRRPPDPPAATASPPRHVNETVTELSRNGRFTPLSLPAACRDGILLMRRTEPATRMATITLEVPDELAERLRRAGEQVARLHGLT